MNGTRPDRLLLVVRRNPVNKKSPVHSLQDGFGKYGLSDGRGCAMVHMNGRSHRSFTLVAIRFLRLVASVLHPANHPGRCQYWREFASKRRQRMLVLDHL